MRRLFTTMAFVSWLGLMPGVARGKVDFSRSIGPIFEASCLECHGPEKQKGKLRLDLRERALKQGDPGEVIALGVAGKSELYRRITLPDGDEDRMPNKGKSLTKEQTDLIRDWINEGADWPDGLVLNFKEGDKLQVFELRPAPKPSKAEIKPLAALGASHIRVLPVAENAGWHEANLRPLGASLDDAAL